MTPDHIPPFALGILVGAWVTEAATQWALKRRLKKLKATLSTPNTQAQASHPAQDTPNKSWWPDPSGQRIELADTGFYITLNPSEPSSVYQGFTPEHQRLTWGCNLPEMKAYMQTCAAARAEFTPQAGRKP
jgi:hypothetical protein